MIFPGTNAGISGKKSSKGNRGFTLPELMISGPILLLAMGAVVSSHIFGLKLIQVSNVSSGISETHKISMSRMAQDIKSAAEVRVGNLDRYDEFKQIKIDSLQIGAALEIIPVDAGEGDYILYYLDPDKNQLLRKEYTPSTGQWSSLNVSDFVSNNNIFRVEDYAGNILPDHPHRSVIGIELEFSSIRNSDTVIGPGNYYTSYRVRNKVTPRE